MRAEFRLWHDGDDLYHIIFDQQTRSRIRVDSFPAASALVNQLMTAMLEGVRNNPVLRHKLFQIDYLTTLSNQAVVSLLYHKSSMMPGVSKRRRCVTPCEPGAQCASDWSGD